MREYIKNQLKRVNFAHTSGYNEETKSFHIPKYEKPRYLEKHCYIVKIDKELINNNTSILATNYNNGRSPKYEYYKIVVNKSLGKIIYVDGVNYWIDTGFDGCDMFNGYLDIDYLTQLKEVK